MSSIPHKCYFTLFIPGTLILMLKSTIFISIKLPEDIKSAQKFKYTFWTYKLLKISKMMPDLGENNQQQWRLTEYLAYLPHNVLPPPSGTNRLKLRQLVYVCICVSCWWQQIFRDLFWWESSAPTIRALRTAREKDINWI